MTNPKRGSVDRTDHPGKFAKRNVHPNIQRTCHGLSVSRNDPGRPGIRISYNGVAND